MIELKTLPAVVVGILKSGTETSAQADPREVFDVIRRGISDKDDIQDCKRIFQYLGKAEARALANLKLPKINRKDLNNGLIQAKFQHIDGDDDDYI